MEVCAVPSVGWFLEYLCDIYPILWSAWLYLSAPGLRDGVFQSKMLICAFAGYTFTSVFTVLLGTELVGPSAVRGSFLS